jgi:hypothetical protein
MVMAPGIERCQWTALLVMGPVTDEVLGTWIGQLRTRVAICVFGPLFAWTAAACHSAVSCGCDRAQSGER